MNATAEQLAQIRAVLAASPSQMTMQLARKLGVPEVEVIRALPEGQSIELDIRRSEELLTALADLGKVHVIVSNGSVTSEVVGEFGGFSTWGEFFNVQTKTLDMHIRHGRLTAAFAVEKPSHMDGVRTHSIQLFDQDGAAAFKVFVTFGSQKAPPERLAAFERFRDRFRKVANDAQR